MQQQDKTDTLRLPPYGYDDEEDVPMPCNDE